MLCIPRRNGLRAVPLQWRHHGRRRRYGVREAAGGHGTGQRRAAQGWKR